MIAVENIGILLLTCIVGGILAHYLIVPLIFYVLDMIGVGTIWILIIIKILSPKFPIEPDKSTICGNNRIYSPNPIQYILGHYPIMPKSKTDEINDRNNNPFPNKSGNLYLIHKRIKELIAKLKRRNNQKQT